MIYDKLMDLKNTGKYTYCLFGAGKYGRTWGYDLLSELGFDIAFYCDNGKKPGTVIRDGKKTASLEDLYALGSKVFVFITLQEKYQESVIRQLEEHGITHMLCVDLMFQQNFLKNLENLNDTKLNERFRWLADDAVVLKKQYEEVFGCPLDLEHPQTFNQKIQWLKLYDRNPLYTTLVDKYAVKQYVEDKIGKEYVIPTLGVWEHAEDIDFDSLPEQFVLKCTHDSGSVIICRDKQNFDREGAVQKLNKALSYNYYYLFREWVYKDVKPQVIAEQYMVDESEQDLKDYKVWTFDGKAKLIEVISGRFHGLSQMNMYTTDWEFIDAETNYSNNPLNQIQRPEKLEQMLQIAEKLAEGIPHVRVDFYYICNKLYFGELTFYHSAGFGKLTPREFAYEVGSWIKLDEIDCCMHTAVSNTMKSLKNR